MVALVALALLAAAPAARAGWSLPARVADGPSPDILSLGGTDLAPDGTGGMAWLKRDAGVAHVFATSVDRTGPRRPVRVDVGQAGEASELRFGSSARYGAMAVWVSDGKLYGARRPSRLRSAWGPPTLVYADPGGLPVQNVAFDVTLFGTGYAAFNVGTDVRVARMPWFASDWTVLPAVDINALDPAGKPALAASADGSAVVAWPEITADGLSHVFARRIRDDGSLSTVPREVSVRSLGGHRGGNADSPAVDVQDDSSYVFLAARQDFTTGTGTVSRVFARRLVASRLERARLIDSLSFSSGDGAAAPGIQVSGRGRGIATVPLRSGRAVTDVFKRREPLGVSWLRPLRLGSGPTLPAPPPMAASMAERLRGVVAWQQSPPAAAPSLRGRFWNKRRFERAKVLSRPAFGPAEGERGLFAASDAGLGSVVGFVQGGDAARRVLVVTASGTRR